MKPRIGLRTFLMVLCNMVVAVTAHAGGSKDHVRLTSLDWPPFSGMNLENQGLSTAVVDRTLARAGLEMDVEFLPWQRAVATGLRGPGFSGYFPEYRVAAMEGTQCLFSSSIGSSPLGFAERSDAPVAWSDLSDLRGRRIGTVRGYVNTEKFDAAVAADILSVDPSVDDATNLRKLAAGRLDLAVIDINVLRHLVTTDPDLKPLAGRLRFNERILEDKTLHVCFRPGTEGEALRRRFDAALLAARSDSVQEAAQTGTAP